MENMVGLLLLPITQKLRLGGIKMACYYCNRGDEYIAIPKNLKTCQIHHLCKTHYKDFLKDPFWKVEKMW